MIDVSIKTFVAPFAIAVTVGILLFEFIVGSIISSKGWLSIDVVNEQVYQEYREDYQKIFFYKLQRKPSSQEIEGLF
jgi:hypothetical protein